MHNCLINKEEFIEIIKELQQSNDYQQELNKLFRKHGVDGCLYQPDCMCSTIKLLHVLFGKSDVNNWIDYFCFNLDFGRKWESGTTKDENGADIKLETSEDLYNFLITRS